VAVLEQKLGFPIPGVPPSSQVPTNVEEVMRVLE
jgi:hypothetical protein